MRGELAAVRSTNDSFIVRCIMEITTMSAAIDAEFGTFEDEVEAIRFHEDAMTDPVVLLPMHYITAADMTTVEYRREYLFIGEDDDEDE